MIASRFTDQPQPVRCRPAADISAPGAVSSHSASGAGEFAVLTVTVPSPILMLLRLVGAHDGIDDDGAIISRLVAERAERIGIAAPADVRDDFCVGGAAVARRSHKPEVASSNLAPATSSLDLAAEGLRSGRGDGPDALSGLRPAAEIPPQRSDKGGGGNPAVPASAAGPP